MFRRLQKFFDSSPCMPYGIPGSMGRRGLVCSPGSSTLSRLKLPCGTAAIADADATGYTVLRGGHRFGEDKSSRTSQKKVGQVKKDKSKDIP